MNNAEVIKLQACAGLNRLFLSFLGLHQSGGTKNIYIHSGKAIFSNRWSSNEHLDYKEKYDRNGSVSRQCILWASNSFKWEFTILDSHETVITS